MKPDFQDQKEYAMKREDIYTLLNLRTDAPQDTVKKAFRQFARHNHPDFFPNDQSKDERFKRVNAAYQSWKLIQDAVGQMRRLKNAAGASAKGAGFQPWNMGAAYEARSRAKFRPWKLDVWA